MAEIVQTIGEEEARRLTTEAQTEFRSSRDHFEQGWAKVEEAVRGGGHIDLGYRSPGDYLHAEFDGVLSGLDVTSRRIAVRTMTDWGLSTRAIAPVIGVDQATIVRDRTGDAHASPEPEKAPVAAAPAPVERAPRAATDSQGEEVVPSDVGSSSPVGPEDEPMPDQDVASPAPRPAITGIDGKTYPAARAAAAAPAPRRRPLPDFARDAGWDLRKAVERLERITADDRYASNKEQVATHLRSHLSNAIQVCQDLLDRINAA